MEEALPACEISVVIPCLNEVETLSDCVARAGRALASTGLAGEIIVADNGSTDGSPDVAAELGARVVHVPARGYGNAVSAGVAASLGQYVVLGDADGSYDFLESPRFIKKAA